MHEITLSGNAQMGILTATPESLDFGLVFLGQSETLDFTIENTGNVPVPIKEIDVVSGFGNAFTVTNEADWEETLLGVDESKTLSILYSPFSGGATTTEQDATFIFVVDANDDFPATDHPAVSVTGHTQWTPTAAVYDESLGTRLDSNGEASLDLGEVPLGTTATQTFRLRNLGIGNLSIVEACFLDPISETCSSQDSFANFTFSPVGTPPDIASNTDQQYVVNFTPTSINLQGNALQSVGATLRLLTSDPVTPALKVNLSALPTNPTYSQNPDFYDFGGVYPSQVATSSNLEIGNTGYGAMTITGISFSGGSSEDFSIPNFSFPAVLHHNESLSFEVTYVPDGLNADTASLIVDYETNGSYQSVITISGEGVDCINGYRDINGDPQDGCECAPTASQGYTCFHPNANTICNLANFCVFDSCIDGWYNLDGDVSNGVNTNAISFPKRMSLTNTSSTRTAMVSTAV